ncbi:MAG: WXG100 family type VII secretion target [Gracilibacteraceae bacterium]|jgi:WXG100 family type VII secretion target|nr:WXG100 family type VII secretion target [Gracilibacteraceae bacterium]
MASATEVTTGKLIQAANRLSDFIAQYNGAVDKFYNNGAEIDTMWDGEASQKFMATLTGDRDRFNALTRILQRYVEVLNQDANTYAKAEEDVRNVLATNKVR